MHSECIKFSILGGEADGCSVFWTLLMPDKSDLKWRGEESGGARCSGLTLKVDDATPIEMHEK